jgi:hypothetical protein
MKRIILVFSLLFSLNAQSVILVSITNQKGEFEVINFALDENLHVQFNDGTTDRWCSFSADLIKKMGTTPIDLLKEFSSDKKYRAECELKSDNIYRAKFIFTRG